MRKKEYICFLPLLVALLLIVGSNSLSFAQERKIGPLERKADRLFIRQEFDKAMELYEEAVNGGKPAKNGETAKSKKTAPSKKGSKPEEKTGNSDSKSRSQSKRERGGKRTGTADAPKEGTAPAASTDTVARKSGPEAENAGKQSLAEWHKAQRKASREAKQKAKALTQERREARRAALKAAKAGTPAKATAKAKTAVKAEPAATPKRAGKPQADTELDRARLHLKIAHLYFMIRKYDRSSAHYADAMALRHTLLGEEDVCEYVDALRFQGKNREAEVICLNSTYKDAYSRSQRYQNTLDALEMRHSVTVGEGLAAERLALNTSESEFWVGSYDTGQLFYAKSYSPFSDPAKLVFHRTRYYALNEGGKTADSLSQKTPRYGHFFQRIPAALQNGPVAFSPGMDKMIATVIEYDKKLTSMKMADRKVRPFRTKLLYTSLKDKKKQFSKYLPVFPQAEKEASYAHPCLMDDGKTLLFTSDMAGGHGGFDLYISRWDEEKRAWGEPVNLGPDVNTAGDEIFPVYRDGKLIFGSNGLPGFGGYDLFSIDFNGNAPVAGTLSHFPYPVNSVFNDYYMYPAGSQTAYFISDRETASKDDIYYLQAIDGWKKPEQPAAFYGMGEENALQSGVMLLAESAGKVRPQTVRLKKNVPDGLLMTLYFDFDSAELTPESRRNLEQFAHETGTYHFSELRFDGFADEFGSDSYNYNLSERRAECVADFLRDRGIDVNFKIQAHGRTKLSPEELKEGMEQRRWTEGQIDWIQVNRRARRVEIYNKK